MSLNKIRRKVMKMNLKFYKNTNEVVLVGIVSAILFVFGFFFETVFKGEALGTVIGISPIEGLLIVPLVILGLFPTLVTAAIYVTLLFVFKGTSTNGIGEVALTLALCSWIFGYVFMNILTRPLKGREPIRGIVTLILAALFTTAVMSVINYVLITPSYFNGLS